MCLGSVNASASASQSTLGYNARCFNTSRVFATFAANIARIDAALRSMSDTNGPVLARQAKTILRGGLQLAVLANVLSTNPVREVQRIKSK